MGKPIVRYESGQTPQPFEVMTNSGDNQTFSASFYPISLAANAGFLLALSGLQTGGAITPGASNDQVNVAAMTLVDPGMSGANSEGVVSVAAANGVAISRGLTTDTHRVTSITVDSSGSVAAVAGVDGTSHSEVRGAAGGPPFIPVDSIEIGQVRTTSVDAATVLTSEIYQAPGVTQETAGFPVPTNIDYDDGEVTFASPLPSIHTGGVPRRVHIKGSTPVFSDLGFSSDWSPAKESFSTSSTDTYDGAVGEAQSSLSTATWTSLLEDGIGDHVVTLEGQNIYVEYRPDRDKLLPRQLTQGLLSGSWTRAASATRVPVSFVLAAARATKNITS